MSTARNQFVARCAIYFRKYRNYRDNGNAALMAIEFSKVGVLVGECVGRGREGRQDKRMNIQNENLQPTNQIGIN